jgi:hypothetical protein
MAVLRLGLSPNRNSMRLDLEHPGVAERWRTISHRLVTINADHDAAMSRE